MSDNITDADREAADDYLFNHLKCNRDSKPWRLEVEPLSNRFARHAQAAVAAREAEIVGMILEYANIANERYVYDDLRKLCAMIQGKPLPKTNAELVQEQIGRAMDRPDKYPSID